MQRVFTKNYLLIKKFRITIGNNLTHKDRSQINIISLENIKINNLIKTIGDSFHVSRLNSPVLSIMFFYERRETLASFIFFVWAKRTRLFSHCAWDDKQTRFELHGVDRHFRIFISIGRRGRRRDIVILKLRFDVCARTRVISGRKISIFSRPSCR